MNSKFLFSFSLVLTMIPMASAQSPIPVSEHIYPEGVTVSSASDSARHELGHVFTVNTCGSITKIRLYAVSEESGDHTARIWRNTDSTCIGGPYTLPAVLFKGINGWVSYTLPEPVEIAANVAYTVSVSTGTDPGYHFASGNLLHTGDNGNNIVWGQDPGRFSTARLDVCPVTAAQDGQIYYRDIEFARTKNLKHIFTVTVPVPSSAARWNLNTDNTHLILTVFNNMPYIECIKNPERNWNWVHVNTAFPLIKKVSGLTPDWEFKDATVDKTLGTKVTLRFTSSTPNLELKSIWWARPGPGPVEIATTIQNNSGDDVTYNHSDVVAADITFTADDSVTLKRFDRMAYSGNDPYAYAPVKSTLVLSNSIYSSFTNNSFQTNADIPFQMFDVNSSHGLYIGYEWSFGKYTNTTSSNPLIINYKASLWDSGSFTEPDQKILNIPSIYIGTYKGDIDDGGNKFKKWFWNYKIPPTMRENTNEPLLEICVPGWEAELKKFYATYPVASWGAEMGKIDWDWLMIEPNDDWFGKEITKWLPRPVEWPNGMNAGTMTHENNLKLSLYMSQTYLWCDLATQEGRDLEKKALLERYDNYHYDYYRSDFICEGALDYLKHEGYMEVLDYMIAQRPGFRYEHCSGGGTLKDFSTLQRVTVMTTEDAATAEAHRMAMYSGTYMINPVQLKADVNITVYCKDLNDPAKITYYLRTGFMGANMATFGCDIPTETAQKLVQVHWPLYTTYMRPILRGADVYHILPVCDEVNWDGLEYFNPSLGQDGRGAVLLFKPSSSAPDSKYIRLKGLDRTTNYTITFQDRTHLNTTLSGADLMDRGINVTGMSGAYASEIIWINTVRL